MNPIKINITILLAKSRVNALGKCSIRCRITYQSKRYEFATGLFINPNHWFSKLQLAKPPNEENTFINTELSLIKNKINQAFLMLQAQGNEFQSEDVYRHYIGKPNVQNIGLIFYYNEYLQKYKRLIGIEIKQITWNKFNYIYSDVQDFVKWKFKKKEFLLKDLDYSFIIEFEYYLKIEKKQKQVTVNKALQRFKKVVKTAVINKLIDVFPFMEHKPKKVTKQVVFLTAEELEKLQSHNFTQSRLKLVKDLFVFCCYTGLPFHEMSVLDTKHIIDGFDGYKWIKMTREKTGKEISIPLLPKALEILGENLDNPNRLEEYVFPKISNQRFNSYLKEIAEIIGIEKNITHHTARKTFASTILLYNDVPMEIVSELLGHSNMTITQEHYGKVVQKKVSQHMAGLTEKMNR